MALRKHFCALISCVSLGAAIASGVTIVVRSSPTAGGTTTGGGTYTNRSSVTVLASPAPGYVFINWTEDWMGSSPVVSTSSNYVFTANSDRNLAANFAPLGTIVTSASPPEGGITEGGGKYIIGSNATVAATPNPDYGFVNWSENGSMVSSS